jgi:hypothetical protein
MKKQEESYTWLLVAAGGVGAFFFLFTDIGREIIDKLFPDPRKPKLADLVHEDPYSFYPSPYRTRETQTEQENPYLLYDQPYIYTGNPDTPYVHPAAAEELYTPPPIVYPETNPITDWINRLTDYLRGGDSQ